MGMFDEIRCECLLPDSIVQDHVFQTKSLERVMDSYTITRDGRLILHEVRYEQVPEEERPHYGTPEWDHPLMRLLGLVRSVPVGDVEVPYHGYIVFYTSIGDPPDYEWFEYRAKFTDGRLVELIRSDKNDERPNTPHSNQINM